MKLNDSILEGTIIPLSTVVVKDKRSQLHADKRNKNFMRNNALEK